jgi:hypothetical protein
MRQNAREGTGFVSDQRIDFGGYTVEINQGGSTLTYFKQYYADA